MTEKPFIAVIGCGYWGKNHIRNMAELGVLAAVCDHDSTSAAVQAEQFNVPSMKYEDILSNAQIRAVLIAVPSEHHYGIAKKAILAGKHVFVEKPLTLNSVEGEELCELAEERGLTLMVGHLLHYHSAFAQLKKMIHNGELGKLQYIYSNRLNLGKIRREENILWSFAPHDVSMILSLADEMPSKVSAVSTNKLHKMVADITTTHLTFPSGLSAHIFVSWLHPFKEQKLVVVGDKGMAVFDDSLSWNEKILLYPHTIEWVGGRPNPSRAEAVPVSVDPSEPLKQECLHFIDCILNNKRPLTDGREGVRVLKVLEASEESMAGHIQSKPTIDAEVFIHESSYVDQNVSIGNGSKIWHFSHILGNVEIGENCVIAQNVAIGPKVKIGNNCKIQNNVSLYQGVILEDGVFCGPSCVFTNVNTPRAEVERKNEYLPTRVGKGATIGANATIVCGSTIGAYALIGAGAVVTKDVPAHALIVGVPGKQIGWVSHSGERLSDDLVCPREGRRYQVINNQLHEIVNENQKITA
jgi:UDP-2-acetamido-3-amino-2,3-dideoxy-glucuronate N-acetyltransferase